MYAKLGTGSLILVFLLLFIFKGAHTAMHKPLIEVENAQDIVALFAHDADTIKENSERVIQDAQKQLEQIIAVADAERSWTNTAYAIDRLFDTSDLVIFLMVVHILKEVSPDESVRAAGAEALVKIQHLLVEMQMNPQLYAAFMAYADGNALKEDLSDTQRYFISETRKDFERSGLDKPQEVQQRIKECTKKVAELATQFATNISADHSSISVDPSELTGMSDDFIAACKKEDGNIILGVDSPTVDAVLKRCSNADVRKKLYYAYNNRAYPANVSVLQEIIALRDNKAKLLGFPSFAAFEINKEMAGSVDRVQIFLSDMLKSLSEKEEKEFAFLTKELPEGVALTEDGLMNRWDLDFVKEQYKKKHHDLDDETLKPYFPMEKTVEGLLSIYEQFFGLKFEQIKLGGFWHEDVRVLKVYDADSGALLSYLLLDMHPRPFKYSHACAGNIVPSTYHKGKPTIEVSIVIANFTKPTADKPSLLTPYEVRVFFHEFGHALHHILGRQELASMSGSRVKRDFVEMPSQMLEEWLWDKEILKMVSAHYETGEPLTDELIDRMIGIKNLTEGGFWQRQVALSTTALNCYTEGAKKDVSKIMDDAMRSCCPNIASAPGVHKIASFGHLPGYASRYYGYIWSKVFAMDLFEEIKKHGLLNPVIGKKYRDLVIGKGGSKDPNELLRDFLGREPNNTAFFKDLGI